MTTEFGLEYDAYAEVVQKFRAAEFLGRASLRVLVGELQDIVGWAVQRHDPQKGTLKTYVTALVHKKTRAFFDEQDPTRLRREWEDEQLRNEARASTHGRARYLDYLNVLVRECRWWFTPGIEWDDFEQQCRLAAFEALARADGFDSFERPGEAASQLLCRRERDRLRATARKGRRRAKVLDELRPTTRTPEEDLLAKERRRAITRLLPEMEDRANKAQRRWLETLESHAGEDRLVAARVAKELGRNRSSGTRALGSLQELAMGSEAARYLVDGSIPKRTSGLSVGERRSAVRTTTPIGTNGATSSVKQGRQNAEA